MRYTTEELWALAWPDVPFSEASLVDRRLFAAHAESLNMYNDAKE